MQYSHIMGLTLGVHHSTVRRWVRDFCKDDQFKIPDRDYTKRKPHSFIDDNDISLQCGEWIDEHIYRRKKGEKRLRSNDFRRSA